MTTLTKNNFKISDRISYRFVDGDYSTVTTLVYLDNGKVYVIYSDKEPIEISDTNAKKIQAQANRCNKTYQTDDHNVSPEFLQVGDIVAIQRVQSPAEFTFDTMKLVHQSVNGNLVFEVENYHGYGEDRNGQLLITNAIALTQVRRNSFIVEVQ